MPFFPSSNPGSLVHLIQNLDTDTVQLVAKLLHSIIAFITFVELLN